MKPQMKLEHEVSFRWLLLFALPTIFSSIFANLYTTVEGIFVARWVDTDALSAINITLPMTYLASALGMMFGTGGNALVAKKLGEGKGPEAREDFSLLMAVAFAFSVVLAFLCFLFLDPLCRFLGSDEALLPYCRDYMVPVLVSIPFAVFGMVFQLSFITVGRAGLGAALSVIGGVLNIVLDRLFMAVFGWGSWGGHRHQHRLRLPLPGGNGLFLRPPGPGPLCGPAKMAAQDPAAELRQRRLGDGQRPGLLRGHHPL